MDYQPLFSKPMAAATGNIIREITKRTLEGGYISFAGGNPAPETFPAEELRQITSDILQRQSAVALQYGASDGYLPLRGFVADWVSSNGVPSKAENVIITTGAQQGIDLVAKVFLNPGDRVLVEDPTYVAALKIFGIYQANVDTVAMDDDGIIPESLEAALQKGPAKLLYLISNFQNPTGVTLSTERRKKIVGIAQRHGLIVIEDDPYGELRYHGERLAPLKSYDDTGNVMLMGSFSKVISPGLRVGYLVAPVPIAQRLAVGKQSTDMHTSSLTQLMVYEYCNRGLLMPQIAECCKIYGSKCNTMLSLMDEYFPREMTWTHPQGGFFLWARLPEGVSSLELLPRVLDAKLAFVPGESFHARGGGENTMRLNFSNAPESKMCEGISKFAAIIKDFLANR